MTLPILYEDGEALVIDKPAGLPVDRPRKGGPSLANHLDALRFGFQREPVAVHRLDTDTSGCLLLEQLPGADEIQPGAETRFADVQAFTVGESGEARRQIVVGEEDVARLFQAVFLG
jgi:hypothetical protein